MITLGIDCGTQGLKAIALDVESGTLIAAARVEYGLIPGLPDGHAEQHPETWWNALDDAVRQLVTALDARGARAQDIAAIGVSGQQHGFVPLDAAHEVIRPAKLWCDTSTAAQCATIRTRLGGLNGCLAAVGNDILPGYTASKILWMAEREPQHFARLRHIALPHDWLNLRLAGTLRMEHGDASGTALYDIRARRWSDAACEAVHPAVRAYLPEVRSSLEPIGVIRAELASAWGIPASTIVSAGGGDNMMAAIGTGTTEPGIVTASLGTSGTVFTCSETPIIDPRGEIAAFCDSTDRWLPLACTMNVTVATEATRRLFSWTHEQFDGAVLDAPPGADGLTFLPYLQGERTPNLPDARGSFAGITTRNFTPQHMARAVLEGVCNGLAYGLNRLRELGVQPKEVQLTGGGANSPVLRRLLADAFGVPTRALQATDGAALGAARQAWRVRRSP